MYILCFVIEFVFYKLVIDLSNWFTLYFMLNIEQLSIATQSWVKLKSSYRPFIFHILNVLQVQHVWCPFLYFIMWIPVCSLDIFKGYQFLSPNSYFLDCIFRFVLDNCLYTSIHVSWSMWVLLVHAHGMVKVIV